MKVLLGNIETGAFANISEVVSDVVLIDLLDCLAQSHEAGGRSLECCSRSSLGGKVSAEFGRNPSE